jgi:ABC-2 type transport system permease protein
MAAAAVLTIAQRDFTKLLRDPSRVVATFIFPIVFIVLLGGSMQASFGQAIGFNYLVFTFTGVYAQTLFQSSALGLISLIEDRENDFSQEIFVSPVSRYAIVLGKILGESLVALPQGAAIVLVAWLLGGPFSLAQLASLIWVAPLACLFGGAFGLLVLSNLRSQRAANQIFPFVLLPQFFLAGVFNPIQSLPWYLDVLSRLSPMRYAVDLTRNAFYAGLPEYPRVVVDDLGTNLGIMAIGFAAFMVVGTALFVRAEQNR